MRYPFVTMMRFIFLSFILLMVWACSPLDFKDLDRNNPCDVNNPDAIVTGYPVPNFSYLRTGNKVKFINNSVNANEYVWNFGDSGDTETTASPTHVYPIADEANYVVKLIAKNACNTAEIEKSFFISLSCPQEPIANFTYSISGKTITFTNLSVNAQSYQWFFGDDATANIASPTHTYASFGNKTVKLEATGSNNCFATFKTTIALEDCNPQPLASFSFANNGNDYTVTFTNTSQNANAFYWNFGDANFSNQANPVHTFAKAGIYTIVLGATNTCGTVVAIQEIPLLFLYDNRNANSYPVVKIGAQYWMAANLTIGTSKESFPFSGASTNCQGDSSFYNQTDDSEIEKYCYTNEAGNCLTYGGLYQWHEAMNYNAQNPQGICPNGWHIPSATEWNELESFLGAQPVYQLSDSIGNSGFKAKMSGYRNFSGGFVFVNNYTGFWTSTPDAANDCRAIVRSIQNGNPNLFYSAEEKFNGYCVRCLQD